jgi:ribosomal protein L7/L12
MKIATRITLDLECTHRHDDIDINIGGREVTIRLENIPNDRTEEVEEYARAIYELKEDNRRLQMEVNDLRNTLNHSINREADYWISAYLSKTVGAIPAEEMKQHLKNLADASRYKGNKLPQIKLVRSLTSLDLKGSKDLVDSL